MSLKIRKAKLSDLPYVYDICLKTGKSGEDASKLLSDPYSIGDYFAAPYLHYDIDSCLILEENNLPIGYMIGALDTNSFNTWMNEEWLPELRQKYPKSTQCSNKFEEFIIDVIYKDIILKDFLNKYPSHLHIDLLPQAQGKGFGKKIISEFIELIKKRGSKGIHLGVGLNNKKAIEFYKKVGFHIIKEEDGALYMGILL